MREQLLHEFDSSQTCNYCGVPEQKTIRGETCEARARQVSGAASPTIIDDDLRRRAEQYGEGHPLWEYVHNPDIQRRLDEACAGLGVSPDQVCEALYRMQARG